MVKRTRFCVPQSNCSTAVMEIHCWINTQATKFITRRERMLMYYEQNVVFPRSLYFDLQFTWKEVNFVVFRLAACDFLILFGFKSIIFPSLTRFPIYLRFFSTHTNFGRTHTANLKSPKIFLELQEVDPASKKSSLEI